MPAQPHRVVVLGGGYAGLTAAARIGENLADAELTLIDTKDEFVERIRLHEVAAGSDPRKLPYKPFMQDRNGHFLKGRATAILTGDKCIDVNTADGNQARVPYDTLVYAPGSYTDPSMTEGAADHAHILDSVPQAHEIASRLKEMATKGGEVLIVGGGLTAIEAATEFGELIPGLNITLAPGRNFSPDSGPGGLSRPGFDHIKKVLTHLGIEIAGGARVVRVFKGEATLEDGEILPFDLCLWAAGFALPELAKDAGIEVTASGEVITDRSLVSVSHPDIVAVGDAAYVTTETAGECRMSCAAGRPMGELAARTVASRIGATTPPEFKFSYSFRCISLGRMDGLIQFVDRQDRPVDQIWTGERGARWKEYICRRTLEGVGLTTGLGPPPDTPPTIPAA